MKKLHCGLIYDALPLASFLLCISAAGLAFRDNKSPVIAISLFAQAAITLIHFANFMALELMPDQSSPRPVGEDDPQARFREPIKNLPIYSAVFCAAFQLMQFNPRHDSGNPLFILFISALLHTVFIQHKSAQRSFRPVPI